MSIKISLHTIRNHAKYVMRKYVRQSSMSPEEYVAYQREQSRIRNRAYRERHKDRLLEKVRSKKESVNARRRKAYAENPERRKRICEKQKGYYASNSDKVKQYQKKYRAENLKRVSDRISVWHTSFKSRDPQGYRKLRSETCYKTMKKRMENDPAFKLQLRLRGRLRGLLTKKASRARCCSRELVGIPFSEFRSYLESKFEPWMNWSNYGFGEGKWVVDHIKPCAKFDLTDLEQQKACFHYTNLRPLCWRANLDKSDSFEEDHL